MRNKKWTKEEFENAVNNSKSIKDTFLRLGNSITGYNTFHRYKKLYNINNSHFCGQTLSGQRSKNSIKKPLNEVLIKDSTYNSGTGLKLRLINELGIENKCKICGITDWNNQPLTLHLDHINGDHWDHRIENLRILCPNCHTQTETYANKKGNKKPTHKKCKCGCDILYASSACRSCRVGKKKIIWPDTDFLVQSIKNSNFVFISKQLGVSDNAIRKHLLKSGIDIKSLSLSCKKPSVFKQ